MMQFQDVQRALEFILTAENLGSEDRMLAMQALDLCRCQKVGFADASIGLRNRARGCTTTVTSDRRYLKLGEFSAPVT